MIRCDIKKNGRKAMINICFTGNRGYFEGLLLCAMSVAKYTKEDLCFYILTMNLEDENPNFKDFTNEQILLLEQTIKKKNQNNKAIRIDVTQQYKTHLINGKNHKNGYTPYAMLRLLLDQLPNIPDKMIYLDIDTMCCSDIKQLNDVDIEDFDVAMAKDYMGRFWIRPSYCNSGILLMNIKNMKQHQVFEKCRSMICKKKMMMPDQTALNKYAKKKYLPFKFNEQRKIKSDTVIKHFCKGIIFFLPFGFYIYNIKQWQREKVHKSLKITIFDDIYEEFDSIKSQHEELFKKS